MGRGKAERQIKRKARKGGAGVRDLYVLGLLEKDKGNLKRAAQLLAKAAKASPEAIDVQCDLGLIYKSQERFEDAVACFEQAISIRPEAAELHSNLGTVYNAWGKPEQAAACFRRALDFKPDHPELLGNLGNSLLAAERRDEAIDTFGRAVEIDPGHVRARANLGLALKEQGRLDDATRTLLTTISHDPEYADAHWNLGLTQLLAGDFENGWFEYEWRRRLPKFAMRHPDGPAWDGSDMAGTLLVHAEQGLGDSIQFARYVAQAAARTGNLIFQCQTPLLALLEPLKASCRLIARDEPVPAYDAHAPLLSLPHLLGRHVPDWPADGAYLTAEPGRRETWRKRLAAEDGIKVALCWQGNQTYKGDWYRSIQLEQFRPLAGIPGVRLISLQKEPGSDQIAALDWGDSILDLGPDIDNDGAFLDSAAILMEADLLISSDTAIPHLAGALGTETWLLLAEVPDWRWGMTGGTTPWYPSMRVFRRTGPDEWRRVFDEIATALASKSKEHTP